MFITMLTTNEITEIFYLCDDFSKEFDKSYKKHILQADNGKRPEISQVSSLIAK